MQTFNNYIYLFCSFDQFSQQPLNNSFDPSQQEQSFNAQQPVGDASGQLENIGYDPNNPNMSNMGWEDGQQGAPTPGGNKVYLSRNVRRFQ